MKTDTMPPDMPPDPDDDQAKSAMPPPIPGEIPDDIHADELIDDTEDIPEVEPMSEIGRLTGVFFEPKKAFADIARRPRWWWPLIITGLLGMVFFYLVGQRVGFEETARQQIMQSSAAQNMTPQQFENSVRLVATVLRYVSYITPLISVAFVFVAAVFLMFLFDVLLQAKIGLKRMMAIVSYSYLPSGISAVLSTVVLYLKPDPSDFDLNNPLAFNLAAFLNSDTPGWLMGLGRSIDLFGIWVILLLAIGVSTASRKVSMGTAIGMLMIPALIIVGLRVLQGLQAG